MSDLDRWKQMCDELNARCNELKADLMQADDVIFQQAVENERLKSELRKKAIDAISDIGQLGEQSAEINHLKAEVERLRKAGDAMAQEIIGCYRGEGYDPADSETLPKWSAAKEGKPSV